MNTSKTISYIQTNGINLHVIQSGPRDGKPLILLHGFPEFWRGWEKQIEPLAQAGYHVMVPDQRGYNQSSKPCELSGYRMDELAKDIMGLMDALEIEKAGMVGHDWGGIIAWVLAALYPERVEKLAVLNAPYPGVVLPTLPRYPEQLLRSSYVVFFQIPGLAEAILRNNNWELMVESMQRSSRPGTFLEEDFLHYRQAWWRKDAMTCMLNWYRALFRRPVDLPRAPRFEMPVLILWGVKDAALGRHLAEACIRLCAAGDLVWFEEASHWLQHEEAEEVSRLLVEFFIE